MNVDLTSKQYLNLRTNAVLKNKVRSVNGTQYSYYVEPDNEVYAQSYDQDTFNNKSIKNMAPDDINYFSGTWTKVDRGSSQIVRYGIAQDTPNDDIYGASHGERWYTPIEFTARFENPTKVTRLETEYVCSGIYLRQQSVNGSTGSFKAADLRTRNSLWDFWKTLPVSSTDKDIQRAVDASPASPTLPSGQTGKARPWDDIAKLPSRTKAPYIAESSNNVCVIKANLLTESLLLMALYAVGVPRFYSAAVETLKSVNIKLFADNLQVSEIKWTTGNDEPAYTLPTNELMNASAAENGGTLVSQIGNKIVNSYGNGRQLAQFDLVDETVVLAIGDTVTLRDILGRRIKNGAQFLVYDITYKCDASERRTVKCMEVTNNG